jgi:hypothetical protein
LRSQDVFGGLGLLHPGEVLINVTLARGDGTASADMTRMGMEMQEQMYAAVEMLRKEAPGFAKCYLIDSGAGVGVRAGRGIVGHETITRADIDNNTSVPEPVAISKRSYGTHYTKGFRPPWAKSQRGLRPLPWKALIPVSFDNVMVGGRAISAEPHVMDTFRLMHTCMATGMAAGITAALAAKTGKDSLSVGYAPVRAELLKRGAILE